MKFAFLVIAIFINFFNHSLIKSEEKIFSAKNKIENIARKESITEEKTQISHYCFYFQLFRNFLN